MRGAAGAPAVAPEGGERRAPGVLATPGCRRSISPEATAIKERP